MVDDELRRDLGTDPRGVAAEVAHRVAHRREIDDRGHAGEVLVKDAGRAKRDRPSRLVLRVPRRDRLDVVRVGRAEDVLEQDLQRVRQPGNVVTRLQRVEAEDLELFASDAQRAPCAEGVGHQTDFTSGSVPAGGGADGYEV